MDCWTDGAYSRQQDIGGWAWVSNTGRKAFGSAKGTTNQRMELQAALDVVQHVSGDLRIHSDSAYVVNCFLDGWWKAWRKNGYKNGGLANLDLWKPLIEGVVDRPLGRVEFIKVKGHSGDPMNDLADHLCVAAKHQQSPTTRTRVVSRPHG